MVTIDIRGIREVAAELAMLPTQARRATELALDFTAKHIQSDVQAEMLRVFDNPVDYTIRGIKTTLTRGHNMVASVWVATPPRMDKSYLVPQVEGGSRRLKGFERGLDGKEFVPGSGVKLNVSGNIPVAAIKKVLAGARQNRSAFFRVNNRRGKLWPGVYQRVKRRGRTSGVKPIMLEGRTGHAIRPQLDFYGVAHRTFGQVFSRRFRGEFDRLTGGTR